MQGFILMWCSYSMDLSFNNWLVLNWSINANIESIIHREIWCWTLSTSRTNTLLVQNWSDSSRLEMRSVYHSSPPFFPKTCPFLKLLPVDLNVGLEWKLSQWTSGQTGSVSGSDVRTFGSWNCVIVTIVRMDYIWLSISASF